MIVRVHLPAKLKLTIIAQATDLLRFEFGFAQGWQQHGCEDGNDSNDDQEFDQGERRKNA
jgi:hypothetical protein